MSPLERPLMQARMLKGHDGLFPLDAELNLPARCYSALYARPAAPS
jgi:hypothetical protein